MLEDILSPLHEVPGVQATLVVDSGGTILAHRSHAIYDLALLAQVGRSIVGATDSMQVVHEDWESITASFADGKVLIRNLRPAVRPERTVMLAVIADGQLNRSFAGVAIRVAAGKLKAELEAPSAPAHAHGSGPAPAPVAVPHVATGARAAVRPPSPSTSAAALPSAPPRADLAQSGLSWSVSVAGSSASGVAVQDAASSAYLQACTKALSATVGPMAKVFVKEAVRRICPERAFSRDDGARLVMELAKHIDDTDDLLEFQQRMQSA
jgi:predicted regulator of Ras-like GTPase activity (Roadblock/LC7/MglB family)